MSVRSLLLEVMDKEPAISEVWLQAAAFAILGALAARYRPWALLVVLPLAALFLGTPLTEVRDPHVELAIRAEAGAGYVWQVYAATALAFLAAPAAGLAWRGRARRA
jgi:hypothetical protein